MSNFTGQKALFAALLAIFFGIKTGDSQMVVKLQLPGISVAADSNQKCNPDLLRSDDVHQLNKPQATAS